MINVTHDSNNRRTGFQMLFTIFIIILFFHLHLLFHINELNIKTKFTGYQFYHFCIQTLVDGNHDTKPHTLADNICKTYIHQVGQFANADKFRYQQFIIFCRFTGSFGHSMSFFTTDFCFKAFTTSAGTG